MGTDPACPACGEPIGQSATYCMHCSTDLTAEADRGDDTVEWDPTTDNSATDSETDSARAENANQFVTGRRAVLGGTVLTSLLGIGGASYYLQQRSQSSETGDTVPETDSDASEAGKKSQKNDEAARTSDSSNTESGQDSLTSDVSGADAPGYVESFEDGTLAEYEQIGGPSVADSAHTYHGDGSLHLRSSDGPTRVRTTTLDQFPSVGDTFRYRFYPTPVYEDGGANLTFALGESGEGYQLLCNFWKQQFALKRSDPDARTPLATSDVLFQGNRWYTVEVDWGQDEITATLRETTDTAAEASERTVAELTAADGTYSDGGLQLTAWANNYELNVHYDAIEII